MRKNFLKRACAGFAFGVTLNYIAAIIVSYALNLGYFMPCIVALPEMLGGEMNAVAIQALACGLLGTGFAVVPALARISRWSLWRRVSASTLVLAFTASPVTALVILLS